MAEKKKYDIEFTFNTSPKVLYYRLSNPSGLSEWFADDVNLRKGIYTFIWDGSEEKAELVSKKNQVYIRFHWLEDEDEETYFEFRIRIDELTNDVALIISDFAEEDEIDDAIDLWDSQVGALKQILGV